MKDAQSSEQPLLVLQLGSSQRITTFILGLLSAAGVAYFSIVRDIGGILLALACTYSLFGRARREVAVFNQRIRVQRLFGRQTIPLGPAVTLRGATGGPRYLVRAHRLLPLLIVTREFFQGGDQERRFEELVSSE